MTVLWEGPNEPPRKRVCLSSSNTRRSQVKQPKPSHSQQLSLANASKASTVSVSKSLSASPLNSGVMMNGYGLSDSLHHHPHHHHNHHQHQQHNAKNSCSPDEGGGVGLDSGSSHSPIATLCNLGNTCFLNSVLYTLRFAPSFLHNLHHLAEDLKHYSPKTHIKTKSSSLGRGMGASIKWNSSKDLPSLGDSANDKIKMATERLHDLYESLHNTEQKDHMEAFQPEVFLHALREVNPIFEGNQQHDAHELLVCLLDNIRETCRQLSELVNRTDSHTQITANGTTGIATGTSIGTGTSERLKAPPHHKSVAQFSSSTSLLSSLRKSIKGKPRNKTSVPNNNTYLRSNKANEMNNLLNGGPATLTESSGLIESNGLADGGGVGAGLGVGSEGKGVGYNFIAEDFEGVTLLRTTCVECEVVTERKETFCDICVPIASNNSPANSANNNHGALSEQKINEMYKEAVVTEEYLHESNKYWCETCLRYNEAKRSVRYESLPRLLTLQLKRFSSNFGSVISKVIDFMPTPLNLSCFCQECSQLPDSQRQHKYQLFGVIMHLGATMASGHYVAYVRGRDVASHGYRHCTRGYRKTASLSGAGGHHAKNATNNSEKTSLNLMRFLKPKATNSSSSSSSNGSAVGASSGQTQPPFYQQAACRSSDCCGLRIRGGGGGSGDDFFAKNNGSIGEEGGGGGSSSCWLECDDDSVRAVSRSHMEEILTSNKNSKNSALTPYLLFYVRSNQLS